ncbi:MAG: SH3 domain-containing protein [Geminicoccaceae bacterium]
MSQCVELSKASVGRVCTILGLVLALQADATQTFAQEAKTGTETSASERLLLPTADETTNEISTTTDSSSTSATEVETREAPPVPSFEELDSAATNLNDALSGARAKLDELRQATELAAMAAELREELEVSIQENNRLAATLAEVQSERSLLENQENAAQREIVDLKQSVDESKIEIDEQKQILDQRQARIKNVEIARADAEHQIQLLEGNLENAGVEITKLSSEIAELSGQLEATRTELSEANERAEKARTARNEADTELSKVRKQIAGMLRSVLLGGEPIDVSAIEKEVEAAGGNSDSLGLAVRYEAIQASNVRAAPSPDAERVGFAKRGDLVTVIGKVGGRNWFEVETVDGVRGFIFGDLIRPAA